MAFGVFLVLFVALLFIGAPIYISMLLPSILYVFMNPMLPPLTFMQKLLTALNNFPLLAVPFFILAAEIMNKGSITERIFGFAKAVVGHFRGGLGYVNIVASVIFSGMSGSAIADVGGLGQIELKAMREAGFDDDFSIGITGASGTVGPIIPPSIPFVVYASFVGTSTGALFIGGMIPGIVMSLCLAAMCFYKSKKRNYPREKRVTAKEFWKTFQNSFLALCMPLLIIGGIWTGWFTPTEAAMVAILYAIILTCFIYRETRVRDLPKVIMNALRNVLPVLLIVVGATVFSFIINYEKVDQMVMELLTGFTSNKYVVLVLVNVVILIFGMFFDSIVAILLMAPIVTPLCGIYGIHPVHLGVVIVLNLMIGLLTPPVGTSLYLLSTMTGYKVTRIIRMTVPWLVPLFISLIMITYCDWFVLFLPRLLGFIA